MPIHVRVGKLSAQTSFENIKAGTTANGRNSVSFTQKRTGNRSIIGNIQIKEKNSQQVVGELNNFSIYMPFTKRDVSIFLNKVPEGPLEIVFKENETTLGNLSTQADIH